MKEEGQTVGRAEEQPDPKLQNQFVWKKNTFVSNNSCPNENPQKVNLCSKPEGKPSFFASFICQNTKDVVRRNHPQHSSTTQKKSF